MYIVRLQGQPELAVRSAGEHSSPLQVVIRRWVCVKSNRARAACNRPYKVRINLSF